MFKQVGADTDRFIKRMGLFSKSFSDINRDMKNGLGLRRGLFSIVTEKDIKSLNDFNKAINKGAMYSEAYNTHMSKSPVAIKRQAVELATLHNQQKQLNRQYNAGKITQQEYNTAMASNKAQIQALITQTQTLTFAQRAAAVASKALGIALNTALNVGIMIAINAIISGIMHLVNRQKEAIEKAKESAEVIKQETDAIDEYIKKTIELRKKLDEENVSLEESKDIRSELRSIQNDLIDKYGEEARGIDLVTGSIEEQTQALYNLNKAKYEDSYQLNKEGYDAARRQMQSAGAAIYVPRILADGVGASHDNDVEALRDFISSEFAKRGYTYSDDGDDTTDVTLNIWEKSADMYTIDEELAEIYEQIENYSQNGSQAVKDAANASLTYISQIRRDWSNKTITENEEMYAQWLKYDSDYSDDYINIIRKQANPHYKNITLADLLKSLGSTATPEEFKAAFQPVLNTMKPAMTYDVQGKANYQYITNNNRATNFTETFNISEATDPDKVAKVVRTEITDLLQKTYNKIK